MKNYFSRWSSFTASMMRLITAAVWSGCVLIIVGVILGIRAIFDLYRDAFLAIDVDCAIGLIFNNSVAVCAVLRSDFTLSRVVTKVGWQEYSG